MSPRAYRTIRQELVQYGHGLADKPEIVGLNKIDALDPEATSVKPRLAPRRRAQCAGPSAVGGRPAPEFPKLLDAAFAMLTDGARR